LAVYILYRNFWSCQFTNRSYLNWTMNCNVGSWTCINFVVMIVKSQINVFRGCNGHKYHLYSKYYIKSSLAMSNSKEPYISLRIKECASNQSDLINILYHLHLDLYLKSMYPWIRITYIIVIMATYIFHPYTRRVYTTGVIYEPEGIDPLESLRCEVYSS
jgi:hypothetical protein